MTHFIVQAPRRRRETEFMAFLSIYAKFRCTFFPCSQQEIQPQEGREGWITMQQKDPLCLSVNPLCG